ncbi:MAG: NAD-dependent epimerase/dehydratase family protein [bacterium]
MRILITGSTGFVGSYLMNNLKGELIPVRIDGTSILSQDADVFIHLAGIAHSRNSALSYADYTSVNKDLAIKAFDAFLGSSARKFILISSVKAVSDDYEAIVTENTAEHPTTYYGMSKLEADRYLLSKNLPAGKSFFILRPSLITGPGVKGNLRSLYNFSKRPFGWLFAAVNNKRSYCNIKNLCFVMQEMLDRDDIESGIYLVADDQPLSTGEIVRLFSNGQMQSWFFHTFTTRLLKFIYWAMKYLPFPSVVNRFTTLTADYVVSNKKIVQALGKSLPYSSIDGIRSIE